MKMTFSSSYKSICLLLLTLIISSNCALQYCPDSYFFDLQHCQKCQDNCKCTSQGTCSQCVDGFTLYQSQCIACPQASGLIYGQCSGCCSRDEGTILACTDCAVVTNYYSFLFAGRCILSEGCFEVDANGFCSQCRDGYYQTNNLCYSCDASCKICTDSTNCLTCADGYYWAVGHGGLCTACPSGCATCDTAGVCYSCLSYYYLYNDHCLNCPANCLTCVDGSTCSSCSTGILVSNLCIQCTDTTYGGSLGCLTCSQDNNFIACQQCDDTYFLDASTGVCRLCSSYITGAIRCKDQNTPTQCQSDYDLTLENRYYLVGISCVKNTKKCKKILDVAGKCATCYQTYTLSLTSVCQPCDFTGCLTLNQTVVTNTCQCTQCAVGYYLTGGTPLCDTCTDTNCAVCPADACSACLPNFYLNLGTCTGAILANCLVLADATNCNTCDNAYYKGTDNQCYQCQANCNLCTDRYTCTDCAIGYYLHPNSYCVAKPANCLVFDTTLLKCTLCEHGFYLYNGFCQSCMVEMGTLSKCQGLCPIDYYIAELLMIKNNYADWMMGMSAVWILGLISVMSMFF